jgi:hypothetical protein
MFLPTLYQMDELGFKLWGKRGVKPSGMDFNDDNISARLDRKWHRTPHRNDAVPGVRPMAG